MSAQMDIRLFTRQQKKVFVAKPSALGMQMFQILPSCERKFLVGKKLWHDLDPNPKSLEKRLAKLIEIMCQPSIGYWELPARLTVAQIICMKYCIGIATLG